MRQIVVACAALVVAACGGSGVAGGTGGTTGTGTGGGSSSGGDCPDLSGTWVIEEHCDADFIGATATLNQTGCSYEESSSGYTCSGSIAADGGITQTCSIDGEEVLACSGQAAEGQMTLSCSGSCSVTLVQQ